MQTFLPFRCFIQSAKCLDDKRLGKQRVEAYQIYRALTGQSNGKGWKNHPAVLMWKGYEDALLLYMFCCMYEWSQRKTKKGVPFSNKKMVENCKTIHISFKTLAFPAWLGNEKFHDSHKGMLYKKKPEHYAFGKQWKDLEYWWPTKSN